MPDLDLLRTIDFGSRVAEEELEALESYFVETAQWQRMAAGEIDIVYGAKGSGKSAIYSLLVRRAPQFLARGTVLISAENPRGGVAFKDLEKDPPSSELQFVSMWKLYFAVLLSDALVQQGIDSNPARKLAELLEGAGLRKGGRSLSSMVRAVVDYISRVTLRPKLELDPSTLTPIFSGSISLGEPTDEQRVAGIFSADELLTLAGEAWRGAGLVAWILLDRLDVAFADNPELEANALRALFKTYLNFVDEAGFQLKIFLRSDIWQRLAATGFREASHITREVTIVWDKPSLLNLIIKRALRNEAVRVRYGITDDLLPKTYDEQAAFFAKAFPEQIDPGKQKSATIDWILGRTRDGSGNSAPREIIHLLSAARDAQVRSLELGENDTGTFLIGRAAFKKGLVEVSTARLQKTIYAEYPSLRDQIAKLDREKMAQTPDSLATIWNVSPVRAREIAASLVEIGLFEVRGSKADPIYRVPFLYKDALRMVQGAA